MEKSKIAQHINTPFGILLVVFVSLLLISGEVEGHEELTICSPEGREIFLREFQHPEKEYGTIPFFVWNGKITRQGIDEMMQGYRDADCGGVIVHPRAGLVNEYLSDEWFDLFHYTVEKGKELGLNVWIYNENSYPSGFAGGHVPAQMPESYKEGQGLQPVDTTIIPTDYAKYALILKKENGRYVIVSDLSKKVGEKGDYTLFFKTYYGKSGWFGGFSYVDLLHSGVTQKFIELTMSGYKKTLGNEFGKTVPGVFADEPQISSPGGVRWTPDLFDAFQKQWGYDLRATLPLLYKQEGDWKKVRHNYTQTLLDLYIDRWAKPNYAYCEKEGLKFTGHYWEHAWPSMRMGGDNMAMYAYEQIPGIDMLFNRFDEVASSNFGDIRSVKEVNSVGNQLGLSRKLSESYGGSGWEETFKDLKRLGDWEYVLGINLMNQHLSYYTIAGARKYDYPPSFSYHNPWWKSYRYLNRYFARLSYALSQGQQKNPILVVEPTTSCWMVDSYLGEERSERIMKIGNAFRLFITTMEKSQVEYDLGSEHIIRDHGRTDGAKFIVGQAAYSEVVIPPLTENLNNATFQLIKKYVASGGRVVVFSIPSFVDGASNEEIVHFFSQQIAQIIHLEEFNKDMLLHYFQSNDLRFRDVKGTGLYHHRRILKDGQLLFLVNSSLTDSTSGIFTVRGAEAVAMNAYSGEYTYYPVVREGSAVRLRFSLAPAQSLLLYIPIASLKGKQTKTIQEDRFVPVKSISRISVVREQENAMPVDFCDLQIVGKSEKLKDLHVCDAAQRVFVEHGFQEGDSWNHSVQYRTSILDRDHFSCNSGFVATYHFIIEDQFEYSKIKAVVERPELWSVSINGQEVKSLAGEWWLDHSFGVFPVGRWIRSGENTITVTCIPMKIHAEIEPIYLVGDFSVYPAEKGWVIRKPVSTLKVGSWKEQGQPFYSWDVTYRKIFDIRNKALHYEVGLEKWQGTVAEVLVNGKTAGTIVLPTDRVEVSNLIKMGINQVEVKITGSLKNLLGPHYSGNLGMSGPWNWRNVKTYPSGDRYKLLDYGLKEDFSFYEYR